MFNIKYGLAIILLLILIVPLVLSFVFHWYFDINRQVEFSVYGLYMILYLLLQIIFASFNNSRLKYIHKDNNELINLIIVGYRENAEYFKKCLEGVKTVILNTPNLNKVYVIIDGNEEQDKYMIDIFKNTMKNENVFSISDIESDVELRAISEISEKCICINKAHSGKRDCLYTGFQLSLIENKVLGKNIDSICCTDSDTELQEHTLIKMHEVLNDNIAGVAGNLGIFNKFDSMLAFLTHLRYYFAFNLERAYQSFNGCVLCISGPVGMYKLESLSQIISNWRGQTFMGKKCTYGDDRHLTNCILNLGKKVVYCENAIANTETPADITRFFYQQTRWSKSAFRESFWNIRSIDKQSPTMVIDLVYTLIYPFVVMGYLQYILWNGTVFDIGVYFTILLISGLIKSIYGLIKSKNIETLFYYLYGAIYISTVFPAKLWALATMTDTSWGTNSRKTESNSISLQNYSYYWVIVYVLWNGSILSGFCFNLYKSISKNTPLTEYILLISTTSIMFLSWFSIFLYVTIKRINIQQLEKSKNA
jgi:hyaluronan synthase